MPHSNYTNAQGEVYPSVTEVLGSSPKPWLDKWRQKWGIRAEQKTTAASNVGSSFHLYAELLTKNVMVDGVVGRRLYKMLENFEAWRIESGFVPRETELHVVSHQYKYAGTLDAIGTLGKGKVLLLFDWKTSSGIYPEMAEQLAAYAQAYFEMTNVRIKKGYIVHISKDKPNHKLTVKAFTLGPRVFNKFLKKLEKFHGSLRNGAIR